MLEQSMNARFESLEQRMTIKLGLMLVAAVAAMATLARAALTFVTAWPAMPRGPL
jgi:hypothetical protein